MSSSRETRIFLEQEFGKELKVLEEEFGSAFLDMDQGRYGFTYEIEKGAKQGSLFIDRKGERRLISDKVSLIQRTSFDSRTGRFGSRLPITNPVAYAYGLASGFADYFQDNTRRAFDKVFASSEVIGDVKHENRSMFLPIRSVKSNEKFTFFRSIFAFGLDRTNRLLETATEQVPVLNRFSSKLESSFGLGLTVKPGRASEMFMRFGFKAFKLGALGVGLNESDYWRSETGFLGNIVFSAATSLAGAYGVQKLFKTLDPKKTRMLAGGAFAAQLLLPGFSEGIGPGMYTMFKNTHIAASALGEISFMNSYRRTVEGILPGASDWKTGAFVGLSLALASGASSNPISNRIFEKLSDSQKIKLGISPELVYDEKALMPRGLRYYQKQAVRSMFFTNFPVSSEFTKAGIKGEGFLTEQASKLFKGPRTIIERMTVDEDLLLTELLDSDSNFSRMRVSSLLMGVSKREFGEQGLAAMQEELAMRFEQGLAVKKEMESGLNNPLNQSFLRKLEEIDARYIDDTSMFSGLKKQFETAYASVIHSFFGATKEGESFTEAAKKLNYKTKFGRYGSLFLGGFLAQQLLTGGLLGSMKGPTELNEIYSGRQLVEVRKGRWWEGGGSSYEGKEISYYKPHDYVIYMSQATDKTRYKVNRSPIHNFLLENFTYTLERENYYDRPYPITGGAFENVPVIGKMISATIGRLIKPPKLMHVNEYMRLNEQGDVEFAHRNEYKGPSSRMGGLSPGKPMSPFSSSFIAGELQYQFRELEGLTGWAKNMYTKALTGEETFGIQRPVLESAGKMFSAKEDFWKKELGGGFFTTEPIRRFLPRERSMIQQYNPIINSMPTWMPDRFKYGDPYRNVKYGEVRLPGAGYAAIHPELKNVNPENYPDIFKYSILADIAPHSREFIMLRESMYTKRAKGGMSKAAASYMDKVDNMLNERMSDKTTREMDPDAYDIPFVGGTTRAVARGAKTALRTGLAPAEYLVPMGFRPSQKLLSDPSYMDISAIESYEQERLYGTVNSFWDKPIRDWFRPSLYSAAHIMGYSGVPGYRRKANETNEYFDKLEFVQQMMIADRAEAMGDNNLKRQALYRASKTTFGVNPQAHAMAIYESLPEGEKAFFDAFSMASERDRERILEMIPEDNKELYISLWNRLDEGDPTLNPGHKLKVDEKYLRMRLDSLQEYFYDKPMPGTDWIGWHEDVEMDDIKIRYADTTGLDLGDLDMYNQRLRLQARMPYLEGAENPIVEEMGRGLNLGSVLRTAGRSELDSIPFSGRMSVNRFGTNTSGVFHVEDDRSAIIEQYIRGNYGF